VFGKSEIFAPPFSTSDFQIWNGHVPNFIGTMPWRGMDSNFQFRARWAAMSRLRPSWGGSIVGAAVSSEQSSDPGKSIQLLRQIEELPLIAE
jgi:hypothetical protein